MKSHSMWWMFSKTEQKVGEKMYCKLEYSFPLFKLKHGVSGLYLQAQARV
jgi:hypothetical protein